MLLLLSLCTAIGWSLSSAEAQEAPDGDDPPAKVRPEAAHGDPLAPPYRADAPRPKPPEGAPEGPPRRGDPERGPHAGGPFFVPGKPPLPAPGPPVQPGGVRHDQPLRGFHPPGHAGAYLQELQRIDPEMYELEKADRELEFESHQLVQRYHRAPLDQRETMREELKQLIDKHFEVRQSRRELQLKRLQNELEELRTAIERRNEAREQIVGRRVADLLGEADDLEF
jgi:hypothetical protein